MGPGTSAPLPERSHPDLTHGDARCIGTNGGVIGDRTPADERSRCETTTPRTEQVLGMVRVAVTASIPGTHGGGIPTVNIHGEQSPRLRRWGDMA